MQNKNTLKIYIFSLISLLTLSSCSLFNIFKKGNGITVNVVSILDKALDNVKAEILDDDGNVIETETTDKDGKFTVSKKVDGKKVRISDLPLGHYQAELDDFKNSDFTIKIPTKVIESPTPEGTHYQINDIMYDFTITDSDGVSHKLSEETKTHKLVVLNFWASYCGPCKSEFPLLNEVYQTRKDEVQLLALSMYDNNASVAKYKSENGYSFPMASVSSSLFSQFDVSSIPVTVIINRFGIFQYKSVGSFESKEEINHTFDYYSNLDYGVTVDDNDGENNENERILPNIDPLTSEQLSAVASGQGFNATYYGDEDQYNWPWIISHDGNAIQPSNTKIGNSFSILYVKTTLSSDEVFAFDYESHTEYNDYLIVFVDNLPQYEIYGRDTQYSTSYCISSIDEGEHVFAFAYVKDASKDDDIDTVYLKNLRKIKENNIEEAIYVKTYAYEKYDAKTNSYLKHSQIYYNEEDGYIHAESVDGPIILADLLNASAFGPASMFDYTGFGDVLNINEAYRKSVGRYTNLIAYYSELQNNSKNKLVSVTYELAVALQNLCNIISGHVENDQWLELCCFFKAYNQEQMEDPIKGLAPFSAYVGQEGENHVNIDRLIMPKGLFTSFTPTESSVYHIQAKRVSEYCPQTMCWIYDENGNYLTESDFGERYYMTSEEPDENFSVYYYFEANHTYYIVTAFDNLDYMGDIVFDIVNLHEESKTILTIASPSFFTSEVDENGVSTDTIIAGGYDVSLEDDGYYHVVLEDGSIGGILYADFMYNTGLAIGDATKYYSITDMIQKGMFNFVRDTSGTPVKVGTNYATVGADGIQFTYENTTSEEIGIKVYSYDPNALIVLGSGSQAQFVKGGEDQAFYINVKPGQVAVFKVMEYDISKVSTDVTFEVEEIAPSMDGQELFDGVDRTNQMYAYLAKMPRTGELKGLVPVDALLAEMLQEFMDKYTIVCEHSWTKLCYFYKTISK